MKVSLIEYTGSGHEDPADYAAAMLIFAKSTRLEMSPGLLRNIIDMPEDQKRRELDYIANTIPASHEFVDYTFMIEGVSRGFTHQLVRTRTASFAQQTMRIIDVSQGKGWDYYTGPSINDSDTLKDAYDAEMDMIGETYAELIKIGADIQDARGVLPTNILTNIVMKINLRNWVDMVKKRSTPRVQDEYRAVLEAMKAEVLRAHPWASLFIERTKDKAMDELSAAIQDLKNIDPMWNDPVWNDPVWNDKVARMQKLLDQIRTQS